VLRLFGVFDIWGNYGQFALAFEGVLSKIHEIRYAAKHPNIRGEADSFIF
jgi:hypothetical protein